MHSTSFGQNFEQNYNENINRFVENVNSERGVIDQINKLEKALNLKLSKEIKDNIAKKIVEAMQTSKRKTVNAEQVKKIIVDEIKNNLQNQNGSLFEAMMHASDKTKQLKEVENLLKTSGFIIDPENNIFGKIKENFEEKNKELLKLLDVNFLQRFQELINNLDTLIRDAVVENFENKFPTFDLNQQTTAQKSELSKIAKIFNVSKANALNIVLGRDITEEEIPEVTQTPQFTGQDFEVDGIGGIASPEVFAKIMNSGNSPLFWETEVGEKAIKYIAKNYALVGQDVNDESQVIENKVTDRFTFLTEEKLKNAFFEGTVTGLNLYPLNGKFNKNEFLNIEDVLPLYSKEALPYYIISKLSFNGGVNKKNIINERKRLFKDKKEREDRLASIREHEKQQKLSREAIKFQKLIRKIQENIAKGISPEKTQEDYFKPGIKNFAKGVLDDLANIKDKVDESEFFKKHPILSALANLFIPFFSPKIENKLLSWGVTLFKILVLAIVIALIALIATGIIVSPVGLAISIIVIAVAIIKIISDIGTAAYHGKKLSDANVTHGYTPDLTPSRQSSFSQNPAQSADIKVEQSSRNNSFSFKNLNDSFRTNRSFSAPVGTANSTSSSLSDTKLDTSKIFYFNNAEGNKVMFFPTAANLYFEGSDIQPKIINTIECNEGTILILKSDFKDLQILTENAVSKYITPASECYTNTQKQFAERVIQQNLTLQNITQIF